MIKVHNCIQNKYLGMCGSATQHVLLIVAKYVIHIVVQNVLPLFYTHCSVIVASSVTVMASVPIDGLLDSSSFATCVDALAVDEW